MKQDRFITKNQLYDDIIQSETAHLRLKTIPEELEMLEFNINGKIDVMKCEIEWSKENIAPLEPALKHMQENVGDLHEELRKLTNLTKKNQNIIDRGLMEPEDRLQAVKNKISQQELLLKETGELLQTTKHEEIGFTVTFLPLVVMDFQNDEFTKKNKKCEPMKV